MATYYTLLTKIGQARIANAVALNQMVNLTYMAVGDGNGNPTTPNENQTALVREKYRATINQLTVDADNPNYLVAEMIVPTTVGGWSIYEVGVFDDQNQLIAVANFPATYKPELVEGSGRDLIVRIVIQVSNTSVVTLKIDPAITLASQAWVAANYVKKVTVAGGTTGQILAKKSNANEDFKWVDPTAAVDVNVFSREETQTVASGQTIVNLAQLTTDGAAIYIEGIRLRDDQFTVNSPTRLTLETSYPAGTKVTIVQNEETSRNAFTLKANNLSDLTDKNAAIANIGLNGARCRVVTSSGTVTLPAWVTEIYVTASAGGGGGGGGGGGDTTYYGGGGGGGGAGESIIKKKFTVAAGTSIPVTIGAAGIGASASVGAGGNGTDGGNTIIGSLVTLTGGKGGNGGLNTPTPGATIAGGTGGSGYPMAATGGDGILTAGTAAGGFGSSSPFGGGGGNGRAITKSDPVANGADAYGYGAGGGGGGGKYGNAAMGGGDASPGGSGGNGAPGIVIIEW